MPTIALIVRSEISSIFKSVNEMAGGGEVENVIFGQLQFAFEWDYST